MNHEPEDYELQILDAVKEDRSINNWTTNELSEIFNDDAINYIHSLGSDLEI